MLNEKDKQYIAAGELFILAILINIFKPFDNYFICMTLLIYQAFKYLKPLITYSLDEYIIYIILGVSGIINIFNGALDKVIGGTLLFLLSFDFIINDNKGD